MPVFVDTPFPPRIALGAQRFAEWVTTVVSTQGGREFRNQERSRATHSFDIGFAVRNIDDYSEIQAHHHMMRGRVKTFPFRDPVDHSAESPDTGVIIDDGSSPPALQLFKRYGSGSEAWDRRITRPVVSGLVVWRTRALVTTNITPFATVDDETGGVSISGGQYIDGDVLTWDGEFLVPCRYDVDKLPSVVINREPGADGLHLVTCDSILVIEDLADGEDATS